MAAEGESVFDETVAELEALVWNEATPADAARAVVDLLLVLALNRRLASPSSNWGHSPAAASGGGRTGTTLGGGGDRTNAVRRGNVRLQRTLFCPMGDARASALLRLIGYVPTATTPARFAAREAVGAAAGGDGDEELFFVVDDGLVGGDVLREVVSGIRWSLAMHRTRSTRPASCPDWVAWRCSRKAVWRGAASLACAQCPRGRHAFLYAHHQGVGADF
ncbi:uncharacterized protein AMSG_07734 [Thecamonas trahens ATCC 50062]|uniref:Uncharacterized protein n=1 Tax=Thecamonas trahens ATCC 50062 TaxID=461836 RepID=A0A0L0DHU0_THETB|nr:hypothetical protein AMSG_07734 [Thecamonas trahens ATCC 50062]KNC51671.1 hypothetical protein AMSG_07734 [Thecamonas trahens ATCC 50062]|eukprot:XP_013755806.1 hypothetical protein AMSG_07734 [Thecamonas trahens ATCC 50062]